MKTILNINSVTLSGIIKEKPIVQNLDIQYQSGGPMSMSKTTANFYFYSSENTPLSSIRIVAWGKNAQELEKIPLGESFAVTGVLKNRSIYSKDREEERNIPEIYVKILQRIANINDDEF